DLDLNEVGVRQAKQIVASLTNEPIHGIYSSNLKRAQQTAQFFSLRHQLPVLIENDVRELDHGELEGLTFSQIKENYSQFIQKGRPDPAESGVQGGDGLVEAAGRAGNGLNRIVQLPAAEQPFVVVSHNFQILSIISRFPGTH